MNHIKILVTAFLLASVSLLNAQQEPFSVEVVGKGDPILLFPGFTCTGEVWAETVDQLKKTHECHIFTFAGFGNTPAVEKPWLPKIKKGVEQYIKVNKLLKPALLGHSVGGALALWLAADHPDDYSQLVLVDAIPSTGALMMPNVKNEDISYDNPYNTQMLNMSDEEFKGMAVQMAAGMTLNQDKRGQLEKWIIMADRKTYVYGFTDLLKLDLRDQLDKIKAPVTILAATEPYGKETVAKNYKAQYTKLADYKIFFADHAAHFIMYDRPAWFSEKIKQAFAK
ncbi:MAG TPA: alpha/beta hydrolase [Leeuwenhoekiella sp.]|nr:alpha/beta hydrolase [Leeuwenhoekiella sp.]